MGNSYTLEKLLGQGRHGATFDGRHQRLGGHHVIRVLALDAARRAAVASAMSQYAAVVHPNLLGPQDLLTLPDEQLAICVPLLPGVDLISRVASQGQLTASETTEVLRQAAAALHALHRRNLVHGNLSAGNLFFVFHDDISVDSALGSSKGGQTVRLLDAGLYLCDVPPGQVAPTPLDDQRALGRLLLANVADLPAEQHQVLERAQADRPESRFPSVLALWQAFDAASGRAPRRNRPGGSVATALVPKITLPAKGGMDRRVVIAGAALVVLAAAAVTAFVGSGKGTARDGAAAASGSALGAASSEVHIAFDVNAPEATVTANGQRVAAADGLNLARGESAVTVSIGADGYQQKTMLVIPSTARTVAVTLTKSAPSASDGSKAGGDSDEEGEGGDRKRKKHHHRRKDKAEAPDPAMRSLPALKK